MKGIAFLAGSALLIVTFFLPFWIYPFGAYQGSDVNGDYYINFHFDKTYESNMADIDSQGYYTIADNKVYISDTKDFSITASTDCLGDVSNFYTVNLNGSGNLTNNIGFVLTICYGLLAFGGLVAMIVSNCLKQKKMSED